MKARALVPLKDLVEAKSRLSGLLSPAQRRALAQAMVEDVLCVLADHPDIASVTLVSDDPSAQMLATKYGSRHWLESALGCRGLNPVLDKSCELLLRENDHAIVVLHADLPCLTAADISEVLDTLDRQGGLVLGCDRHQKGTNLLAFDVASKVEFSFGAGSCAAHLASADARGIQVCRVHRPGIALDIDEPRDLALLLQHIESGLGGHCSQLFFGTALGSRIATQLASLDSGRHPTQQHRLKA